MTLTPQQEKQIIIDFVKKATIEETPGGAEKIANFNDILRAGTTVYVTFLPGSDFADTVKTVKRLKKEGFNPVPHFAARSIPSKNFLEENLKMLQAETGVKEGLLIGGGVTNPVGDFTCSMEVLKTGLFEKYGIQKMGVAGHPEGSPDILDVDCMTAIREKNAYSKDTDMELYIATQFVFESQPCFDWERRIREEGGNELPVHIGVPGLATVKTLMRLAKMCGAGPSVRMLTRRPTTMMKLMLKDTFIGKYINAPSAQPDQLVRELAVGSHTDSDCLIRQFHMYPLGGLKKSADWMYAVADGNFELSGKGLNVKI
ncbi:MAG: metFprotein [Alphaproteobacteria bacterium]